MSCALAQWISAQLWEAIDPNLPLYDKRNVENIMSRFPQGLHQLVLEHQLKMQHWLLTRTSRPYYVGAKRGMPDSYFQYLLLQCKRALIDNEGNPDFSDLTQLVKENNVDGFKRLLNQVNVEQIMEPYNLYDAITLRKGQLLFDITNNDSPKFIKALFEQLEISPVRLRALLAHGTSATIPMILDRLSTELLAYVSHITVSNIPVRLLSDGKSVDLQPFLDPALYAAIDVENEKAILPLIQAGANVNSVVIHSPELSKHPETPLMAAIRKSNKPIAQLLIQKGANVNAVVNYKFQEGKHMDKKSLDPLTVASRESGSKELVRLLIDNGAVVSAQHVSQCKPYTDYYTYNRRKYTQYTRQVEPCPSAILKLLKKIVTEKSRQEIKEGREKTIRDAQEATRRALAKQAREQETTY